MTKWGPWSAGEVGDSGAPEGAETPARGGEATDAEARAAELLDQWRTHHDGRPDQGVAPRGAHASGVPIKNAADQREALEAVEALVPEEEAVVDTRPDATVSTLDEIRARLRGRTEQSAPPAQPIPLRPGYPAAGSDPADTVIPPDPADAVIPPDPVEPATPATPGAPVVPETPGAPGAPSAPPKHAGSTSGGVRSPKHVARRRVAIPGNRSTDSVTASREVVGAFGGNPPAAPDERAADQPTGKPGDATAGQASAGSRSSSRKQTRASAPVVGETLNVEFAPKLGARRLLGVLLLAAIAATCVAGYLAYDDPRTLTLGAAGTLLVVTLALYAVRAGSSTTRLAIRSGQLVVTHGKNVETFDLTSRFTRIEVVGKPGRPGWKVLLGRFGKEPLVISSSVVDPKKFTAELARYQPRD